MGINPVALSSVIVFVGDSTFKTEMPENVTYARDSSISSNPGRPNCSRKCRSMKSSPGSRQVGLHAALKRTLSMWPMSRRSSKLRPKKVFGRITLRQWWRGWQKRNCQAVWDGERSVKYLTPYAFKVAVSDSRIVRVDGRRVYVRYKKTGSKRWRTMEFGVMEFMRRFLQHVLPTGFVKVRYYGFLSPSATIPLEETRAIMEANFGIEIAEAGPEALSLPTIACPHCGGGLKHFLRFFPSDILIRTLQGAFTVDALELRGIRGLSQGLIIPKITALSSANRNKVQPIACAYQIKPVNPDTC